MLQLLPGCLAGGQALGLEGADLAHDEVDIDGFEQVTIRLHFEALPHLVEVPAGRVDEDQTAALGFQEAGPRFAGPER